MQIVLPMLRAVDSLEAPEFCYPEIEVARPTSCPRCGQAARPPGRSLGIVGHGGYMRQVLGVEALPARGMILKVRRFLCRRCRHTSSVLPDLLHPKRWYGAWAILEVLLLYLVAGQSLKALEQRFRGRVSLCGWPSVRRWCRELLAPLWKWRAREVGKTEHCRTKTVLQRLLGLVGVEGLPGNGARAGPRLGRGTVHEHGRTWSLGQDPIEVR